MPSGKRVSAVSGGTRCSPRRSRLERHLDPGRALGRHVGPDPAVRVRRVQHRQADAVAHRRPRVGQHDRQRGAGAGELRLGRHQVHRQSAQGAVAQVHADQGAAGQQEGEQVAQVELVVDRADQQHEQGGAQHEARPGRQDVDVALGQRDAVGQRQPGLPPLAKAPADEAGGVELNKVLKAGLVRPLMAAARPPAWRAPARPGRARRRPPGAAGAPPSAAGSPARRPAPRSRGR